jgi:serine/threonine protein phosphatase PrpC
MEFVEQASSPYLECKIEGLDKNQDIAFCGKTNFDDSSKDYYWFVGCDGHGKKDKFNIIEVLKQLDWNYIMCQENSFDTLLEQLKPIKNYNKYSGSTYYEAKIFKDRVEICNVGDSGICVFIDKNIVYSTTPHNLSNAAELERLSERIQSCNIVVDKCQVTKMKDNKTIHFVEGEYYEFDNDRLALTQSLGHNNITGLEPERKTIYFEENQDIQIIGGSDGLWDVVMKEDLFDMNAVSLAELAKSKWQGEWNVIWNNEIYRDKFHSYDDVTVCYYKNKP